MGRKKLGKRPFGTGLKEAKFFGEKTLLDPKSRDFVYDELDDFHEKRDERDLGRLKFKGVGKSSDQKEDVLGLGNLSSDEEKDDRKIGASDDELFMDDDIVDAEDSESEDERAWGKRKGMYFGTDITDERIHRETVQRKGKEELIRMEEESAKKLQERMAQQLEGLSVADLIPEVSRVADSEDHTTRDSVKVDVSSLSNKKKVRLLSQESPEFFPIVQDLKDKVSELKSTLIPLANAIKEGKIESSPVADYVKAKYCLCLNYISNICSYMMVKTSDAIVSQHPVIIKLAQYRHLFKELEPCEQLYQQEVNTLVEDLKAGKLKPIKKSKKKAKLLSLLSEQKKSEGHSEYYSDDSLEKGKLISDSRTSSGKESTENYVASSDSEEEHPDATMEMDVEDDQRRPIGKEIMDNKGLMPKRNKEMKNPRLKYKGKYKNKLKRRKGQVVNIRREVHRYGGEISGIKKSVVKSRRLQ